MAEVMEALREDHRNIARLLNALEHQIGVFEQGNDPDYDVIRGVADYFTEFPDRCHHPKEDLVFAQVKAVRPDVAAEIGDLPAEHRQVHESVNRFVGRLGALLNEADIARAAVVDAAREFIDTERRHMRLENERIFPLMEQALSPADWSMIEAVLADGLDPLFGGAVEARFRRLSERLIGWEQESLPARS
jgi:hemerythrin-like domain-containing protein